MEGRCLLPKRGLDSWKAKSTDIHYSICVERVIKDHLVDLQLMDGETEVQRCFLQAPWITRTVLSLSCQRPCPNPTLTLASPHPFTYCYSKAGFQISQQQSVLVSVFLPILLLGRTHAPGGLAKSLYLPDCLDRGLCAETKWPHDLILHISSDYGVFLGNPNGHHPKAWEERGVMRIFILFSFILFTRAPVITLC